MKKKLLLFLLMLFTLQLHAADYYWVGGSGNWSDLNHWRLGSGTGSIPSIVPAAGDNVIFGADAGFTPASRTITVDGNAFCNNMTWTDDVPNAPIIIQPNAYSTKIYRSVYLNPTVTYTLYAEMLGSVAATINANGPIKGAIAFTMNKPGSGVTLVDDLINNSGGINFLAGYLNASNRNVGINSFVSATNENRSLDISNSTINTAIWTYIGNAKTLNSAGSFLATSRLAIDNSQYAEVEAGSTTKSFFSVANCRIEKLTFTATAIGSGAIIHSGNTIELLTFNGAGAIVGNNNTIQELVIAAGGHIEGNNNVISSVEIGADANVFGSGNNITFMEVKRGKTTIAAGATPITFGTLLTAPNKGVALSGATNITARLRVGGAPCDGFTEITGTNNAVLNFSAGATADIDNVLLASVKATGAIVPIAVNGIDDGGNSGFSFTESAGAVGTLYWVGGAGDWNDKSHWSATSGGVGGACIPFKDDDVVFDANSGFTSASKIVTTSSNTYFKNMTWTSGVLNSPIFNESSAYIMRAYGSVTLQESVTVNADIHYIGTNAATLQVNGNKLGALYNRVVKTGAGSLTLLDDWSNPTGTFDLTSGSLNLENRNLVINTFVSGNYQNRVLNIQNATIHVSNNWYYDGSNKQIQSAGSFILSDHQITVDGLSYPKIHLSSVAANGNIFSISNTAIAELRFTGNVLSNYAPRIGSGNTVDLLEFNGGGAIGANNTIGFAEFKGTGHIMGSGNIFGTLLTAPNQNYFFGGTTTITDRFRAVHPSCTGLGEIRGYNNGVGTIAFGTNAQVEMTNVYLENMIATGGGGSLQLPVAFSGADAGGNKGWTISSGTGSARYWIGGGGDWNDASHWSETSGGAGGACIPTVSNDVYFDQNSGFGTTVATRAITVNNGNAYFHNMSWAGALNSPVLSKASSWAMESWGNSLVLNPTVTLNILPLKLKGSEATILSGQTLGSFDLDIRKPGGSLTIANDYRNKATHFNLYEGSFIAIGRTLEIANIDNNSSAATISINIEGSIINGAWRFNGASANHTLFADNSVINADAGFFADGLAYNIVNVSSGVSNNVTFSNTTINELTFTNPSLTSSTGINGNNNKLGTVEYKGSGIIHGNGNEIETLIFFPGNSYTITSGTNNTIRGEWFGSGTPCKPTEIKSSGAPVATLTKTSGKVDFDYVRLQRIAATGGATFKAGTHTTDMGGNSGWDIAPYDGVSPILGLGPDIGLKNSELPYTIKTDGFFGSPLSQYVWSKDGITIGSGDQLVVTEPGTYRVDVTFPDACAIYDDITISLVSADLSIVKTVDNSTPAVGDDVVFTLVAHNGGPADGTGLVVADKLPAGYTYVSHIAPAGTTYDATTGLWTIGDLALNTDVKITITAKVNAAGPYLNEASITGTTDDPEPTNNTASVDLVPSSSLIITQPTCAIETGTIEIPLVTGGTYSIDDGTTFHSGNIFADLELGDYLVVVKVGSINSAAITATINEAPAAPDAPLSSGNQSACLTNPIQTLTATATVPQGHTIVWYDAPSGGNIVNSPVLNRLGNVVYYAEANNGTCNSKSRTAVVLSIDNSPLIDPIANQAACGTYTLPTITGANLTGAEAYYTEPNGAGTKYSAGRTLNNIGTQILYIYDKAEDNVTCEGDINVTNNTSFSDNIFIHQHVSPSHHYYPRTLNPDFWKGTANQAINFDSSEGSMVYLSLVGDLNINGDPACTSEQVEITVGATFKNEGPARGAGYSGRIAIMNKLTGELIYLKNIQSDFRVGVSQNNTITTLVPAADLLAGNLTVIISAETAQDGYKNWTISDFKATYKYYSGIPCPDEKSFELTINPIPLAPVTGGDQIVCATNPIQTLTATAIAPKDATVEWYDAAVDGNIVVPTLNTIGTVTYYAEAKTSTCVSASRTPVILKINLTPAIDPIADIESCVTTILPPITGTDLSGNQAYYTEINKGGIKYSPGDVFNTSGETTLYAYDENAGTDNTPTRLVLKSDATYTDALLKAIDPNAGLGSVSTTFPSGNIWDNILGTLFVVRSPSPEPYNVFVGSAAAIDPGDVGTHVLVSMGITVLSNTKDVVGDAGRIAILDRKRNVLLYEQSFSDITRRVDIPLTIEGIVSVEDIKEGNIGIFVSLNKTTIWSAGRLSLTYQPVQESCAAQQSFKVKINPAPAAPIGHDQTVCAELPVQTLTATATVPSGSSVIWYDVANGGTPIANPTLSTIDTKTYYAETETGDCISVTRTPVVLTITELPVLTVQNPDVVCHPGTIDITDASITAGSTSGLTFTYFKDAAALFALANPATLSESGTYYIKGTNPTTGCSVVAPVIVQFVDKPDVIAVHPTCVSPLGSIKITSPLGTGFEYSIDGGLNYVTQTEFTDLPAGIYNVKARNTLALNCESDVNIITINSAITTISPLVSHPGCGETKGKMEFPIDADYKYFIDDVESVNQYTFELVPGTYRVKSELISTGCIGAEILVKINPIPYQPIAPTGSNQEACEGQMLTASALLQPQDITEGAIIVWYDAASGGNVVTSPTLNTVGSVVYYAESTTGTCTSSNRTPVSLTIVPKPVIDPISNINVCGPLNLPAITGTNLSGNQAYYTAPNGAGTEYKAGVLFNTVGTTTLYAYDTNKGNDPITSCLAEVSFQLTIRATSAGTIDAPQIICKNAIPVALSSTTDGTGAGTVSYRWERSTTDATTGFTAIAGSSLEGYTPGKLSTTTWFRRITVSTASNVICESSPTTAIKITVQDEVIPGAISASQTICNNTAPIALSSVTAATGSGTISYRWESSTTDDFTGFTAIGGATSANYSPTALPSTTWFRRIAIATDGATVCESVPTPAIKVTVLDAVTAGTISTGQIVCNNTSVTLNSVTAGTGFGTISYRWESSTTDDLTGFTVIGGATLANYSPAPLTTTTWFRRITVAKLDGVTCESDATMATKIEVQNEVIAGTIGTSQTICINTIPAALTSLTPGTGSGTITYRWEKSSASAPAFAAITGATTASYVPAALTETTWFRRISISTLNGVQCESAATALIEITVQGVTSPGAITANQTICNGSIPEPLTSITAGTGSGTITYRWESSTTDALNGFTIIPTATAANYAPGILSTSTWFRRIAISKENGSTCESVPSAAVAITVQDAVTAGSIGTDQVICNNTIPAALTSVAAGTGSGVITYRWESSSFANTGFTVIQNAVADSYSPPAITTTLYFRRITISTEDNIRCESAPTTAIKITVQETTTPGTINEDQTICFKTVPLPLTSGIAGTGSGIISYRWESSTVSPTTGFTTIAAAQAATYAPVALGSTTYFRRITISTQDGLACESVATSVVTVTVQDVVTAGVISADQTICLNTVPAALTSASAGTGSGTISYRWENSTTSTTTGFVAIPGAITEEYTPSALTATTYFRRISISTTDGISCESVSTTVVTINVQTEVTAGTIAGNQTICKGSVPTVLMSSADGTGSGTLSYRWESSVIDGNTDFVTITGATAKNYTPVAVSVTTYFRRITISTQSGTECESVPTAVIIVEINSAPNASNQSKTVEEGQMLNGQVNGTDEEGDALTYSKNTDPTNGVAVVNADGSYTYMPNPGYSDNDSFTIAVSDGCEISIITITITVTPGPKPSISVVKTGVFTENYITYSFTVKNTGNVPVFDLKLTDANLGIVDKPIDVPGGLLPGISITVTEKYVLSQEDKEAGTVSNTATVNAVDGRGTAVKDVSGTAEANDAATVTPVAKPLFAKDDHHEANANKVIKENVLVNDDTMGQDVNKLTVEVMTQPKNGKLVQNPDGTFTYTPNPGFTGTDSYTYRIKDEYGYYSNVATVFFKTNFFDIKVPTLFTPDGDGINETFEIRGLNQFADNELIIVNRWGNEVYRMRNYQNNWNGEGLNEGTYYYLLRVKNTGDQEWVILKGYTTLVRGFRK